MSQNNNPQAPPAAPASSIPDQRFEELQKQMRAYREENQQLRGQVDFLARQGQKPNEPKSSPFKPDAEKAIEEKFASMMQSHQQNFAATVGMMKDDLDQTKFETRYRDSNYAKYLPRVEEEMASMRNRGQWMPREEVLKHLYFEETGRKAKEPATQATPQGPVWDPYVGRYVNPPNTVVAAPEAPAAADQRPPPFPRESTQPQGFPAQPLWKPELPSANPPPAAAAAAPTNFPTTGLTMNATEKDLDAWASRFGDQPI